MIYNTETRLDLIRREIATAALQGMLARAQYDAEVAANASVKYADALMRRLGLAHGQ